MHSRNDRNPSFCSERMKLCQKHLSKVYNRSKIVFLRARGEREDPGIHPVSDVRTYGGREDDSSSKTAAVKLDRIKVSPYVEAVAGLFDGQSLLKKLHLKRFQISVNKSSNSSPQICPKFCRDGESKFPANVPYFLEEIPASQSVCHTATSWACTTQPSKQSDLHPKDSTTGAELLGPGMCSESELCRQSRSMEATLQGQAGQHIHMKPHMYPGSVSTLTENRIPGRQADVNQESQAGMNCGPILSSKHRIDAAAQLNFRSLLSNTSAGQRAVFNIGFPSTSLRSCQQVNAGTRSTSILPPKKHRMDDSGNRTLTPAMSGNSSQNRPHSTAVTTQRSLESLQCRPDMARKLETGADNSIVEATNASLPRDPGAPLHVPNLSPKQMREALGNDRIFQSPSFCGDDSMTLADSSSKQLVQIRDVICDDCTKQIIDSSSQQVSSAPLQIRDPHPVQRGCVLDYTSLEQNALSSSQLNQPMSTNVAVSTSGQDENIASDPLSNSAHIARVVRTSARKQERSSNNLWKYGSMALCTENPVRDYTTGAPPQDFRFKPTVKVNWSRSGSRKVVNHVCQILKQHRWGATTVETLDSLKGKLNSHCVNAVIQQLTDPALALKFFYWAKRRKEFKHDVYTYTTMINALGRARNLRGVKHLLEDMHAEGCEPTVVTYNTLILIYGKVESLNESLRVFRIMKEAGFKPDNVTYSILIHLCVKSGFLQEALKLYQGMLEEGVQPDTITYSIVIDSLGKSGNLSEARKLFHEMKERGCVPNEFTYNSLIDRHAKARQTKYALRYYNEMRSSGFELNPVICTTMMSVMASVGQFCEAENLFFEMQQAGIVADTAAYSLMINMWGQAGNLDKAVDWYGRMLSNLVTPSLSVFTSLVNAHLDSHLYEGAQHFITSMGLWGISPDLKVYTSLLRHCTGCEKQEHVDAVLGMMGRLGHPAHSFVFELLTARNQDRRHTRSRVEKFFDSVQHEDQQGKQAFANALIEFLHKLQCKTDPGFVWEIALEKHLFPSAIIRREAPNHWLIDLHSMSVGTALVALPRLLVMLRDSWIQTPTKRVYIVTGWGKRSKVTGSSAVKRAVNDMLRNAKSPFSADHTNAGVFVSYGPPFCDWISQPSVIKKLGLEGVGSQTLPL